MNVYQHVIPGMQAEAANLFWQLLREDLVADNTSPDRPPGVGSPPARHGHAESRD
jgi:hypothetical protein